MKNIKKLTLIDGSFTYDEAKEILLNIFSSKIKFHTIKNWSSQERFGIADEIAHNRVPALKEELEKLEAILAEAKATNKQLVVSSEIHITLLDK